MNLSSTELKNLRRRETERERERERGEDGYAERGRRREVANDWEMLQYDLEGGRLCEKVGEELKEKNLVADRAGFSIAAAEEQKRHPAITEGVLWRRET